jgi:hypothetical protein
VEVELPRRKMTMRTAVKLVFISAFLSMALLVAAAAQAQDDQQAALVVRFSDERVEQLCVTFTEPEITGQELLERSGLVFELLSSGMGSNVCRVEDVGCSSDNCFCQCQGGNCVYWSYWRLQEDGWRYSSIGAHASTVTDGSVEGWSWGPGSVNQAISPPPVTFEEVCASSEEGVADEEPPAVPAEETADAVAEVTAMATAEPVVEPTSEVAATEEAEQSSRQYLLFGAIVAGLFVLLLLGRVARRI